MTKRKRAERLPAAMEGKERAVALRFLELANVDLVAIHFGVESDDIRAILTRSRTIEMIRKHAAARLVASIPAAVDLLTRFVTEKDVNKYGARTQLEAAKILLDRTGTHAKPDSAENTKEFGEMTQDELRTEIARLESEMAGRARDITPVNAQDDEGMAELLGL